MNEFFKVNSLSPATFDAIDKKGYISVPLLTDSYRDQLLSQAKQESGYELSKMQYRDVKEELELVELKFMQAESVKAFSELRDLFKGLIERSLLGLQSNPFTVRQYYPNDVTLQRYRPGMLGITPHVDSVYFINLIAIFNLSGDADLYHCQDSRHGKGTKIDTTPGNVVLLKAPGFYSAMIGNLPFHAVSNFRSERYICTLRQNSQLLDI